MLIFSIRLFVFFVTYECLRVDFGDDAGGTTRDGDECINHGRIELGAAGINKIGQRFGVAIGGLIRALLAQSIVDIGHSHNSRWQGDLLPSEPTWVATPVPLFVVAANHGNHGWVINEAGNAGDSQIGVAIHHRSLIGGKLASLEE